MIRALAFLGVLLAFGARAQPVTWLQPVTPGHAAVWTTNGVVQDGGTPSSPKLTGGIGILNSNQTAIGIDNADPTQPYDQLGFGVTGSAAWIQLTPFNGAPNLPLNIVAPALNFIVNGTVYPFPGTSQTPGGNPSDVQFNRAGTFGGVPGFTFDGTSVLSLGVPGTSVGGLTFGNGTAGTVTLTPAGGALGTSSITIPAVTATMATQSGGVNGQCASWNASLILVPVTCGGGGGGSIIDGTTPIISGVNGTLLFNNSGVVGHIATTGTGSVVLSNGGTMVAPNLGTPASVILTNGTGLPFSTGMTGNILASQMVALPTGDVYQGNGSAQPAAVTASALLDSLLGSAQGTTAYRNSTVWTGLAPGTSGFFLQTQGPGANPMWAAAAGGSGCTISGGAQYQIVVNNGASGCSSSANASVQIGALVLGQSGTLGSVTMGNATSGTLTLQPVSGALGTLTASLPANTGTVAELNLGQTWSAPQTFTNSDLILLGSGSGATTFASANAGSSNFTTTVPAITDTLVTLTASQTLTNKTLTAPTMTAPALGTIASGNLAAGTGYVIANLTGGGTGVLAALGNATNATGGFVTFSGNIGTPTAGVATNLTGTAAGLTAGTATAANGLNSATTTVVVNSATAPSSGQVLRATSSTTATWQAESSFTFANPTGTAGPTAVNGSATTAMRSDAAPAVQKGSNAQFGIIEGDGQSLSCTAGVCSTTAADNTFTSGHTIAATDMGGQVNMNGSSLIVTIPAISSTVFAAGQTAIITNQNASALTISSTPTINNFAGTSIPQYGGIALTSNGTSLDAVGLGALANQVTLNGTAQVLTGGFAPTEVSNGTVTTGTKTIDCRNGPLQTLTNGGAFTLAMNTSASQNCRLIIINNGSAGTITPSGFSEGSNTGDSFDTTNTHVFSVVLDYSATAAKAHFLVSAYQ